MEVNQLFEHFRDSLFKNREEFTANQFKDKLSTAANADHSYKGEKTPIEVVKTLAKIDPTRTTKHLQFIAKMYLLKQFKIEDTDKIKELIKKFEKFKSKIANKDLNSYKNLDAVYDVLEVFTDGDAPVSGKAQVKELKSGAKKIIDTPSFKVVVPLTEEASKFYGANTQWCTAADNNCQYQNYASKGDLYIVIAKIGGKDRKFQLHYETDSFMNERDTQVSKEDIVQLSKFPEYADFLNLLIKKFYGPSIEAMTNN